MPHLRIASFNLENLSDRSSMGIEPLERHAILRPQLERLDADVLCLQEVDAQHGPESTPRSLRVLDELLAETPYRDFYRVHTMGTKGSGPRDRHNLVILSRWPIRNLTQYANTLVPPPRYHLVTADAQENDEAVMWDRPILHASIALPDGGMLEVINMHLKAPLASFIEGQKIGPFAWKSVSGWAEGFYVASIKRAGQALEARMLLDRIFDGESAALIAVCGDFNAEEREVPVRILMGNTEDTGNGQLASRELVALEHTLPEHRRFTVIHAGRKQMLDHILVSRSLLGHYRNMEIHNEALGDEIVAHTLVEKTLESYHAPVVAAFDFQGEPSP